MNLEGIKIEYKNILKLFLITIFVIGILNFVYADSAPNIGENQAKSIAQDYLNSHNLPYKVTTATRMVHIKNRQTGSTKYVTLSEWDSMTGNNKFKPDEDPTFQWEEASQGYGAWKVATVDSQGKGTGSIYINDQTGTITKKELKAVTTQTNSTKSNKTNATANATNQTAPGTTNDNTWIIIGIIIVIIAAGAGYWFFIRK